VEKTTISKTVLFVDDEKNILASIRRGLRDESYPKLFAGSGDEALKIMENEAIAVLVTDMRMPGMNGLELLKIVQEMYPDVVRIILTGYSQISTLISAINSGQVFRYLTKPWKLEADYIPAIRQAIEFHQMQVERKLNLKKLKAKNLELNKRNFEIQMLLKENEKINKEKTELLEQLTSEIIPFVEEVIGSTGRIITGSGYTSVSQFRQTVTELNEHGEEIYGLLKEVERKQVQENEPQEPPAPLLGSEYKY
jgi:two-component system, NtrC family, response regulator HupR/HoxA